MRARMLRIAVAACICVAAGLALSADEQSPEQLWETKQSDATTAELQRRDALLESELASGSAPEWAGKYFRGDGLGVNVHVTVAPKSGFTFAWYGCLGRYDVNYGTVSASNGRLALGFELPNSQRGFEGIPEAFVPVRWGERLYLLGADQAKEFANAVNSGREPCQRFCSEFLLREGDELIDVEGAPGLPPDWSRYLLSRPIEANLLQLLETTLVPDTSSSADDPYSWRKTRIEIAAGRKQGVWQGMTFFDSAPDSRGIEYTVVSVGPETSVAESRDLVSSGGEDDAVKMPVALSTRMYSRGASQ